MRHFETEIVSEPVGKVSVDTIGFLPVLFIELGMGFPYSKYLKLSFRRGTETSKRNINSNE